MVVFCLSPGGPRHSAGISYVCPLACAETTWKILPHPHNLRVWKQETAEAKGGCGHSQKYKWEGKVTRRKAQARGGTN